MGIEDPRPRLAWTLTSRAWDQRQTAYEILVASSEGMVLAGRGDVWRTGKVRSPESTQIAFQGKQLRSRARYYWRVRVWDDQGRRSRWSEVAWWEMGLLDDADWHGAWIGQADEVPGEGGELPAPLLRTEFTVDRPVQQARVYASGLAYAYVFLNGIRVGDRYLDPAFTVYDETVPYVVLDVAAHLHQGPNALGVTLGRGYYGIKSPGHPYRWWSARAWHGEPRLRLQLEIWYADGTSQIVSTSSSWKVSPGPTIKDSVYGGETYDARLEQAGWTTPQFDDASWASASEVPSPPGQLEAQTLEPIRVVETLTPVAVTEPQPGVLVHDFGYATAGWARISLRGEAGTTVEVNYGEKLNLDGSVDHGGAGVQSDRYVLRGGGVETWEPTFSYKGFRYVEVRGDPNLPEILSLEGRVAHTDVASSGDFTSSNDLFNQIHRATRNTLLNNFHGIPTDTPMYEKLGWMGDGHLNFEPAIHNFDVAPFFSKWLADMVDEQAASGTISVIVPTPVIGESWVDFDPAWSAAFWDVLWNLYWYYGDQRVLERYFGDLIEYMDAQERLLSSTGYIWEGPTAGDWGSPAGRVGGRLFATAYAFQGFQTAARIAGILGRPWEEQRFREAASRVREAFNTEFFRADRGLYEYEPDTEFNQTANLLPVAFGIVPEGQADLVMGNVAHDVEHARGNHLRTGALGTEYLLPLLTAHGFGDIAYRVANQTTYPSWGFWLEQLGSKTLYEFWEADARSHQHAFLGTVTQWFYGWLAGMRPAAPGFARVLFEPHPVGELSHAALQLESVRGDVGIKWIRVGQALTIWVQVPPSTKAEVRVPARRRANVRAPGAARFLRFESGRAVYVVGSGVHSFTSKRIA